MALALPNGFVGQRAWLRDVKPLLPALRILYPLAAMAEVWVVNDKGKEFVGDVVSTTHGPPVPLPSQLIFTEYTRDDKVMRGEANPALWPALLPVGTELKPGERGNIMGFNDYLTRRGKAAIASLEDGGRCAMLPGSSLIRMTFYVESTANKRRRVHSPEEPRRDILLDDVHATEESRRDKLVDQLPEWSRRRESPDDCMVFRDGHSDAGVYYQDARRKYEFRCGRPGLRLLVALREVSKKMLDLLNRELAELDPSKRASLLEEGRQIYAEKPSLRKFDAADRTNKNVTWSNDEYAHAGLRAQYLRLKSLQRFSETFNLLHRATAQDTLARELLSAPSVRCASLGGGPAFELFALEEFSRHLRGQPAKLELYSLDLQPAWKVYAEALGCKFAAPFDVHNVVPEDVIRACDDKPLDLLVVSYLLIYCTTPKTADLLADLLKRRLVKLLVISERTRDQGIVSLLRQRQITVVPLLSQQRESDFRQMIALLPSDRKPLPPTTEADFILFPNVPFARGT